MSNLQDIKLSPMPPLNILPAALQTLRDFHPALLSSCLQSFGLGMHVTPPHWAWAQIQAS